MLSKDRPRRPGRLQFGSEGELAAKVGEDCEATKMRDHLINFYTTFGVYRR